MADESTEITKVRLARAHQVHTKGWRQLPILFKIAFSVERSRESRKSFGIGIRGLKRVSRVTDSFAVFAIEYECYLIDYSRIIYFQKWYRSINSINFLGIYYNFIIYKHNNITYIVI